MRAIITGATGALGTALCEECIKQNIEVLALITPGSSKRDRIPKSPLITVRELGLEQYEAAEDIAGKYDVFFHLAWASTCGDEDRAKVTAQAMNIKYALDAVELAGKMGCVTFVGAGSQAEYGRTEDVLTEETECHPETPYGIAKLCAGQLTRIACKQHGIKHIWPRILSAYGPNCQPQTIVNYTISELLDGNIPELTKCEQIWDFIYTGDVARALLMLADKGHDGEVYVIGSKEAKPLKEYITQIGDIVAEVMAGESPEANVSKKIGFGMKPYTENTVMHLSCNIAKLTKDTGFVPEVTFEEGIRRTISRIRDRKSR